MAITKEVIRQCLISKREEIENAEVVFRPFDFDENGNYVLEVAIPEKELFLNDKNQPGINMISGKAEIIIKDYSILERLFNK